MKPDQFQVAFGVFSPPLEEQLAEFKLPKESLEILQADSDAITRLSIRGMLTDGETRKARNRLMKEIGRKIS